MSFSGNYFNRHLFFVPHIEEPPSGLLRISVVIPVYLETGLISVLKHLLNTYLPKGHVEVIMVFNCGEGVGDEVKSQVVSEYEVAIGWCQKHSIPQRRFIPILIGNLPNKHAGAGLARKIGMDLALKRFDEINQPEGIILSLDADTVVEPNYFTSIEKAFFAQKDIGGCIIYFEHPLHGSEHSNEVYKAITQYELHLRYYKHMLTYIGFPFSNYTIGSCFGVRALVYARYGGMNRQKAGEDFYFLNKLFPHVRFIDINETCVHPSARPSNRVPFGTGPVVQHMIRNNQSDYYTYSPSSFLNLKELFTVIPAIRNSDRAISVDEFLHPTLTHFLKENNFPVKLDEIKKNTSSEPAFYKRFLLWFDGFKVVKYLNSVHLEEYSKVPVMSAVKGFLKLKGLSALEHCNASELLMHFRKWDREGNK